MTGSPPLQMENILFSLCTLFIVLFLYSRHPKPQPQPNFPTQTRQTVPITPFAPATHTTNQTTPFKPHSNQTPTLFRREPENVGRNKPAPFRQALIRRPCRSLPELRKLVPAYGLCVLSFTRAHPRTLISGEFCCCSIVNKSILVNTCIDIQTGGILRDGRRIVAG